MSLDKATLEQIEEVYDSSRQPWVLGFSGGKDSSAVLKLVFNVLVAKPRASKQITVVYCDTGVEIPVLRDFVDKTLQGVRREALRLGLPLKVRRAVPPIQDRYFVKVIGRGYPPPTNIFRWCTDRLRIDPVRRVLKKVSANDEEGAIVLLGVRRGESEERDRKIGRHTISTTPYLRQSGSRNTLIYSPIIDYNVEKVWETLAADELPISLDYKSLAQIYRGTAGECPIVRDVQGPPCGSGRFGCWTCTVVRKDSAVRNLINFGGHSRLGPLLEFRDWLAVMRDDPDNRAHTRRNGTPGLGPLTLGARREILRRLSVAERKSGYRLIDKAELAAIRKHWAKERQ